MQEGLVISGENLIAIAIVGTGEDVTVTVTGGMALFGGWLTIKEGFIDGYIRECLFMVGHRIFEGFFQVGDKILALLSVSTVT